MPVTMPVLPTVASAVLLLLQAPPVGVELRDVVSPVHTCIVPVMAEGIGFTVNVAVIAQPVASL